MVINAKNAVITARYHGWRRSRPMAAMYCSL